MFDLSDNKCTQLSQSTFKKKGKNKNQNNITPLEQFQIINWKIAEIKTKLIILTYIHGYSLTWLDTGTETSTTLDTQDTGRRQKKNHTHTHRNPKDETHGSHKKRG